MFDELNEKGIIGLALENYVGKFLVCLQKIVNYSILLEVCKRVLAKNPFLISQNPSVLLAWEHDEVRRQI